MMEVKHKKKDVKEEDRNNKKWFSFGVGGAL